MHVPHVGVLIVCIVTRVHRALQDELDAAASRADCRRSASALTVRALCSSSRTVSQSVSAQARMYRRRVLSAPPVNLATSVEVA